MTTYNKVKAWRIAAALILTALVATGLFNFNSVSANAKSYVADAGNTDEAGLVCTVNTMGTGNKLVTITNQSDQVIAKATKISFDQTTGAETVKRLRSDLKPGKTQVVHLGRFDGFECKCRINQN